MCGKEALVQFMAGLNEPIAYRSRPTLSNTPILIPFFP